MKKVKRGATILYIYYIKKTNTMKLKSIKELIIKSTGCERIIKRKDKYIIYFKRTDYNFWLYYKILSKQEVRDILLTELGI